MLRPKRLATRRNGLTHRSGESLTSQLVDPPQDAEISLSTGKAYN
jgi:hypothetical protein